MAGLTASELDVLRAERFTVVATTQSALLGRSIARIQVPPRLSVVRSLRLVRALAPSALAARNDRFPRSASRYRTAGKPCGQSCAHFELTAWMAEKQACSAGVRIGVIDTAVDVTHPSLQGAAIEAHVTRSADRAASRQEHGTGVVSLLVGNDKDGVAGLTPRARVLAVDAFHHNGSGSTADTYDLVAAFDWLAVQKAQVINLSFSGPDNPLLKEAVARVSSAGVVLIAAAGTGRNRSDGYPARYEQVVAVAAVNNKLRAATLSARGSHISFAAPGVGIVVAGSKGRLARVDGTSFAAPFVTAAYAIGTATKQSADKTTGVLSSSAKDLGAPGRDPIFGWGVIQYSGLPRC